MLTIRDLFALVEADYRLNERKSLRNLLYKRKHLFRHFDAAPLTTRELLEYAAKRRTEGASASTINNELSAISQGFKLAIACGLLDSHPRVPRLRVSNRRTGFLSAEGFARIHRALEVLDSDVADICSWLYQTGWRQGEAKALTWDLVDSDLGAVSLTATKTDYPRRVALWGPLRDLLEKRKRLEDGPHVFHRHGKPIRQFYGTWQHAVKADGLRGTLIHDMRRSFARNSRLHGVPRAIAKEIAGWKTDSVFERYAIVDEADQRAAFQRMLREG